METKSEQKLSEEIMKNHWVQTFWTCRKNGNKVQWGWPKALYNYRACQDAPFESSPRGI